MKRIVLATEFSPNYLHKVKGFFSVTPSSLQASNVPCPRNRLEIDARQLAGLTHAFASTFN